MNLWGGLGVLACFTSCHFMLLSKLCSPHLCSHQSSIHLNPVHAQNDFQIYLALASRFSVCDSFSQGYSVLCENLGSNAALSASVSVLLFLLRI